MSPGRHDKIEVGRIDKGGFEDEDIVVQLSRQKFAFYGAQRSPFCFRTAAFRSQRPPIF